MSHPKQEQLEAYSQQGIESFRSGNLEAAISNFEAALELEPQPEDEVNLRQNLAGALCTSGELSRGILHFRRVLELEPQNSEVLGNLGLALKKSGNNDAALEALTQALSADPFNVAARVTTAQVLQEMGKLGEARMQFESVIESGTNEQAVAIAVRELQTLELAEEPKIDFQEHADKGADAFNAGLYAEALEHFRAALNEDPEPASKKAAIYQDLAVTHFSLGNTESGIECFEQSLAIAPPSSDTLKNYATALGTIGQTEKATSVMGKAMIAKMREDAGLPLEFLRDDDVDEMQPDLDGTKEDASSGFNESDRETSDASLENVDTVDRRNVPNPSKASSEESRDEPLPPVQTSHKRRRNSLLLLFVVVIAGVALATIWFNQSVP